jgi:hypothetical protein
MPKYLVSLAARWTEYAEVVVEAGSPEEAAALAEDEDYDDLAWSGMDGDGVDVFDIELLTNPEQDEEEDTDA